MQSPEDDERVAVLKKQKTRNVPSDGWLGCIASAVPVLVGVLLACYGAYSLQN
jgi:hypothetical protein